MLSLLLLMLVQEGGMNYVHEATQRNVWVETKSHIGSGVIVQNDVVLTNFHLLEVDSDIAINNTVAKVIAIDTLHDLILLRVETVQLPPLRFSVKVQVPDSVFYVGNTNLHRNFVSTGRLTFIDNDYLYSDTIAIEGCSGGGLYNTDGELIGLNVGHEYHSIAFHIKARTVLNFLEANKELLK